MLTPEMLSAKSLEKVAKEEWEEMTAAPAWGELIAETKAALIAPIAQRITAYLKAEIEAGRGGLITSRFHMRERISAH